MNAMNNAMSGKRVLIVEDEQAIREMISFALRRAGLECLEAADGQRAQVQLADKLPDVILMDWMLPDVSGIELIRRFKRDELTRQIPIIMLTARGDEDDKVHGLDSGADDYLTKPYLADLALTIRQNIEQIKKSVRQTKTINM